MKPLIKIDLISGKFNLYGKTNRAHKWKVHVKAIEGDLVNEYEFELSHKMPLRACMAQLGDIVWSEIKELVGRSPSSVICEVGI